ncbi:MAG TPA: DoxX family protein [Rhodanobacteraceae bacterium]
MSGVATSWGKAAPYLRSILRIVMGFLFMQHGCEKLFGFLPGHGQFHLISSAHLFTLHPGLAGILEFGGGLLILLGLFTRPVAFILSGEMAFAYFMVHIHGGLWPLVNYGGMAVAFCFVFLYLSAAGGGPWGIDSLRGRK